MKLLYIHQYFKFPNESGGTRSYDLATSFAKKGITVSIISSSTTQNSSKKKWNTFERNGITFYMLNCYYDNKMSFFRRVWSFLYFMIFASMKALKIKSDLVLATSTPLTIAIPAIIKKVFQRTPFIFEVRDVWPEVPIKMGYITNKWVKSFLYAFERYVYKKAEWIVPLSVGMKKNICSRIKLDKLTVIPNISEVNRFNLKFTGELKQKTILYAGTMGEVNGLKYLLDLAVRTQEIDSSIKYYIFGQGKQKESLVSYARNLKVLDVTVFFKGSVTKSELPDLYAKSVAGSSFVIDNPVLWDNSANKFFDSLAAGKPIIINHLGWQADTIRQYDIGYVLAPQVSDTVADNFVKYINNYDLLRDQGRRALQLAKEKYSLEVAVDKYMSIFDSVLK